MGKKHPMSKLVSQMNSPTAQAEIALALPV
jgi:hypothetical protein